MEESKQKHKRAGRVIVLALLGLGGVAFNLWVSQGIRSGRNVDFDDFYAAGKLAGTGHLYDWNAIQALEREHHSSNMLPFGRIPIFALAFKPLSALPYVWASVLWMGASLAAMLGFVALWPGPNRMRNFVLICWSFPAAMCLALGQDTLLFLSFAVLGLWLLGKKFPFTAGLALSLCVAKPHLALLLPIWLIATARWRAIAGGVTGGFIAALISFSIEGLDWPKQMLQSLPNLATAPLNMPNLRGLVALVGGGTALEIALASVVGVAFWGISRFADPPTGAALALAGGLLLSHHAYAYDAVLLFPALLLSCDHASRQWLRRWGLLLFTPFPYLVLLTPTAWPAHLVLTGYTFAWFACEVFRQRFGSCVALDRSAEVAYGHGE